MGRSAAGDGQVRVFRGGGGGSCTQGLGGGQGGATSSDGLISGGQVIMAAREVPCEAHPLAQVVHLFICDMFC